MSYTFQHEDKTYWAKEMRDRVEVYWIRKHELGVLVLTAKRDTQLNALKALITGSRKAIPIN